MSEKAKIYRKYSIIFGILFGIILTAPFIFLLLNYNYKDVYDIFLYNLIIDLPIFFIKKFTLGVIVSFFYVYLFVIPKLDLIAGRTQDKNILILKNTISTKIYSFRGLFIGFIFTFLLVLFSAIADALINNSTNINPLMKLMSLNFYHGIGLFSMLGVFGIIILIFPPIVALLIGFFYGKFKNR